MILREEDTTTLEQKMAQWRYKYKCGRDAREKCNWEKII
jgi:hypothetical protein